MLHLYNTHDISGLLLEKIWEAIGAYSDVFKWLLQLSSFVSNVKPVSALDNDYQTVPKGKVMVVKI